MQAREEEKDFNEVYKLLFGEADTPFSNFVCRARRNAKFARNFREDLAFSLSQSAAAPVPSRFRVVKRTRWKDRAKHRAMPRHSVDRPSKLPLIRASRVEGCCYKKTPSPPPAENVPVSTLAHSFDCGCCGSLVPRPIPLPLPDPSRSYNAFLRSRLRAIRLPQEKSVPLIGVKGRPAIRGVGEVQRKDADDVRETRKLRPRISVKMEIPFRIDQPECEDAATQKDPTLSSPASPSFSGTKYAQMHTETKSESQTTPAGPAPEAEKSQREEIVMQIRNRSGVAAIGTEKGVGRKHGSCAPPSVKYGTVNLSYQSEGQELGIAKPHPQDRRSGNKISPMFYDSARKQIKSMLAKRGLTNPEVPVRILLATNKHYRYNQQ